METIRLIAFDVFGYGDEAEDEALVLGTHDPQAATRVAERIGAFMELGAPLGNASSPSNRRRPFVGGLVEDALQFLILHEFAHICLGHDRDDVRLLKSDHNDLQIATFSMGQEHQADRLALRLHASFPPPLAYRIPKLYRPPPDSIQWRRGNSPAPAAMSRIVVGAQTSLRQR